MKPEIIEPLLALSKGDCSALSAYFAGRTDIPTSVVLALLTSLDGDRYDNGTLVLRKRNGRKRNYVSGLNDTRQNSWSPVTPGVAVDAINNGDTQVLRAYLRGLAPNGRWPEGSASDDPLAIAPEVSQALAAAFSRDIGSYKFTFQWPRGPRARPTRTAEGWLNDTARVHAAYDKANEKKRVSLPSVIESMLGEGVTEGEERLRRAFALRRKTLKQTPSK